MIPIIIVLVAAVFSWFFFLKTTGRSHRYVFGRNLFNPLSYNFAIYLFTGFLGSVAIAIAPDNQQINTMVDAHAKGDAKIYGFLIMLYGGLVFAFAFRFFKSALRFDKDNSNERTLGLPVCTILTLLFLVASIFYTAPRIGPLVAALTGKLDSWDILALRATLAESEMEGFFIRRTIVEGLGWVFVLYLAGIKNYRLFLYILACSMSLYFLASLAKIKLVLFILSIFMVKAWGKRFGVGAVLKVASVVFLALVGVWAIFVKNLNPEYLFSIYSEGLVGRIFISEISALYPHLSIFGSAEDFLGISSLSNLITTFFDIPASSRSGRIVLEITSPEWVEAGIGGVYNTVFFGEAYANFGLWGLFISPIWVVLFYAGAIWAAKFLPGRLRIAFLVHTALNTSVMAGFNDFLWNPFLVAVYFSLLLASRWRSLLRKGLARR